MHVFVVDKHKKPLTPCRTKRARELLRSGRAVVPKGKCRGTYTIRIGVRKSRYFALTSKRKERLMVKWNTCSTLQRGDGYVYIKIQRKYSADSFPSSKVGEESALV